MSRMNRAICAGLVLIICAESPIGVSAGQSRGRTNSQPRGQKSGSRAQQQKYRGARQARPQKSRIQGQQRKYGTQGQRQKMGTGRLNGKNSTVQKGKKGNYYLGPQAQTNRPNIPSNGGGMGGGGFGGAWMGGPGMGGAAMGSPGFAGSGFNNSGFNSPGMNSLAPYDPNGVPLQPGANTPPSLMNTPEPLRSQSANAAGNGFPPVPDADSETGNGEFSPSHFNPASNNRGWSRVTQGSSNIMQASGRLSQPSRYIPRPPGTVIRSMRPPTRQRLTEQQMLEMSRTRGLQR